MHLDQWIKIIDAEYFRGFVKDGGGTIRFAIIPHPSIATVIRERLRDVSANEHFGFVDLRSESTRLHLMDRLFNGLSRQVNWEMLARTFLLNGLQRLGYAAPEASESLSLTWLAQKNNKRIPEIREIIRALIQEGIQRDSHMTQEFRIAMTHLCLAQIKGNDGAIDPFGALIKDWLTGDLQSITFLKPALIFEKVRRHNARFLFQSATHWFRKSGLRGVTILLDITRYMEKVPTKDRIAGSIYYAPGAVMELYEVLRQFIDGIEELGGVCIIVIAPLEFLHDEARGVQRYQALKMRIWDDVRARSIENPLGSFVRLA